MIKAFFILNLLLEKSCLRTSQFFAINCSLFFFADWCRKFLLMMLLLDSYFSCSLPPASSNVNYVSRCFLLRYEKFKTENVSPFVTKSSERGKMATLFQLWRKKWKMVLDPNLVFFTFIWKLVALSLLFFFFSSCLFIFLRRIHVWSANLFKQLI